MKTALIIVGIAVLLVLMYFGYKKFIVKKEKKPGDNSDSGNPSDVQSRVDVNTPYGVYTAAEVNVKSTNPKMPSLVKDAAGNTVSVRYRPSDVLLPGTDNHVIQTGGKTIIVKPKMPGVLSGNTAASVISRTLLKNKIARS